MLIVMREHASQACVDKVINFIESNGFETHLSTGKLHTVIGAVGDKVIDPRNIELLDGVQEVIKVSSGFKLTSRMFQSEDSIIEVNGIKFGGKYTGIIAGPCTVESYDQMDKTAEELVNSNEMVSKLLYYGYGGPAALEGQLDGTGNGLWDDGLTTPETHYLYTHVLLSIAYSGDMMGVDLDGLETLGIGLKGLYNYIASLPMPVSPTLSDSFTASFDPATKLQKTNTVTFNGASNAVINVTLQDGVTLHNVTTNTSETGTVSVSGGQSFYLTAPLSVTEDYTSGNIAGSDCTRFVPLAIYGSGNTQTHGSYTYDVASALHKFYYDNIVLEENEAIRQERLTLVKAVKKVLGICFDIIGISKVERMWLDE